MSVSLNCSPATVAKLNDGWEFTSSETSSLINKVVAWRFQDQIIFIIYPNKKDTIVISEKKANAVDYMQLFYQAQLFISDASTKMRVLNANA